MTTRDNAWPKQFLKHLSEADIRRKGYLLTRWPDGTYTCKACGGLPRSDLYETLDAHYARHMRELDTYLRLHERENDASREFGQAKRAHKSEPESLTDILAELGLEASENDSAAILAELGL